MSKSFEFSPLHSSANQSDCAPEVVEVGHNMEYLQLSHVVKPENAQPQAEYMVLKNIDVLNLAILNNQVRLY